MVVVLYLVDHIIQVYENELFLYAHTPPGFSIFLSVFVSLCFRCRHLSQSGSVGSWVLAVCPELSSYNLPPIRPSKLNLQDIWVKKKKKSHCTNFYLFLHCNIACGNFNFLSMLSFNIWLYYDSFVAKCQCLSWYFFTAVKMISLTFILGVRVCMSGDF